MLRLLGGDAQGVHHRIGQLFLAEATAGHGAHREDGDALVGGCAVQCRLQFGIERALLSIGDDDQPAHLTVTEHQPDHIKNVIVLAHHVTHSHIVDEELAEMGICKGLGVEPVA